MAKRDVEDVIQETVERKLNPVRFSTTEQMLLWLVLVLAAISVSASLFTLILTY